MFDFIYFFIFLFFSFCLKYFFGSVNVVIITLVFLLLLLLLVFLLLSLLLVFLLFLLLLVFLLFLLLLVFLLLSLLLVFLLFLLLLAFSLLFFVVITGAIVTYTVIFYALLLHFNTNSCFKAHPAQLLLHSPSFEAFIMGSRRTQDLLRYAPH